MLFLLGCPSTPVAPPEAGSSASVANLGFCGPTPYTALDADGDGYSCQDDCDDLNPTVYPDAASICYDGVDNSCGTRVEEPCPDGKGFPANAGAVVVSVLSGGDFWGTPAFLIADADSETVATSRPRAGGMTSDVAVRGYFARPVGDVTGDGIGDVADDGPDGLSDARVWTQAGDEASTIGLVWPEPAGDVDGDGVGDLWAQVEDGPNSWAAAIFVGLEPGTNPLDEDAYGTYGYDPDGAGDDEYSAIGVADLSGDGLSDLINYHAFFDPRLPPNQFVGVVPGPLNQVADMTLWYPTFFNPDVVETWVEGPSISGQLPIPVDVDDDGRLDLLTVGTLNCGFSDRGPLVFPVDLDGHFVPGAARQLWVDEDLYKLYSCGDVDVDGRDDVLALTAFFEAGPTVAVYPTPHEGMDRGDVLFGVSGIGYGASMINHACVDVDADGDAEIGVSLSWYEGGSSTQFASVLYPGGL